VIVDRHDGVEFVNGHVNVFVRNESDVAINGKSFRSGGIVIDFEPQVGARNSGDWLTQDNILARFYNNRGTEFLVQRDYGQAYAYYKAAIETDPTFVPSFSNLAQLYSVRGLLPASEQLLRHALALGGDSYAPLRTLHRLLTDQARLSEAQDVAKALAKLQDEDPYYWFGKGLVALREGRNGNAVDALERAAELTTGFEEIHYHLGLAYLRNGQRKEASRQMAALSAINTEAPGLAVLNKKMAGLNAVTSLQ
jgi:tetratricopeptide (TPR) repeat protein